MKRKIYSIIAVNVFIFLALWGCAETACYFLHKGIISSGRIFQDTLFDLLSTETYVRDKDILLKLRPNESFYWGDGLRYHTGKDGWRAASAGADNSGEADIKVIVTGDSCTFGLGVSYDQIYSVVLEKKIHEKTAQKVKVYNFSAPGFTSFQCRKIIEKTVPLLKPAAVVCYVGANDGSPVLEYSDKECYQDFNDNSFAGRYLKYSNVFKLFRTVKYKRKISFLKKYIRQLPGNVDWFEMSLSDAMFELGSSGFEINRDIFNKERVSVKEFKDNLAVIKNTAQKYKAAFIYIPNVWKGEKGLYYYEDFLLTGYLDIIKEFQAYKPDEILIDAVHPSAKGHNIIAEALFKKIENRDKNRDSDRFSAQTFLRR